MFSGFRFIRPPLISQRSAATHLPAGRNCYPNECTAFTSVLQWNPDKSVGKATNNHQSMFLFQLESFSGTLLTSSRQQLVLCIIARKYKRATCLQIKEVMDELIYDVSFTLTFLPVTDLQALKCQFCTKKYVEQGLCFEG